MYVRASFSFYIFYLTFKFMVTFMVMITFMFTSGQSMDCPKDTSNGLSADCPLDKQKKPSPRIAPREGLISILDCDMISVDPSRDVAMNPTP